MTAPGLDSWYHEKESAWLYQRVAAAESDPRKRRLFEQLASAAEEQASRWEQAAARGTEQPPRARSFTPALRARIVAQLLHRFEPRSLRAVLAAMKLRGLSVYAAPAAAPSGSIGALAGHAMPTSLAEVGARHRSSLGGSLRAAVFGVNDGLVSNMSLVLGVAGAGAGAGYVLTAGAAGLLAGALSMAAGEYVSVRSQREMYEYQMALEREELQEYPEEEAEELALIYQARGVELEQARAVSRSLLSRPEQALDVLAREELGLNPDDLGSPWRAASASFVTFAAGAALPLAPFIARLSGTQAIVTAAVITAVALFAVGLGLSLFTGRDALRSALRMVLIGGGAGTLSFLVGRALGVAIG
ncbi:MAG TPA: VIT1/CCC1 transporter family protein [Steroidobacteraceae bacterium]|nr:VIT1/CCC1 transporter family protein [Steroidobacteraceae bacterium]